MGQRHQVYVRYNEDVWKDQKKKTVKKLAGFHHQWLWGYTACRQLSNLLRFYEASVKEGTFEYGPFGGGYSADPEAFKAIYSVDIGSGYYHRLRLLDSCDWPENEDNNNGITVVDFTGKKPRYGFVSLYELECLDQSKKNAYKNWIPMGAEEYLSLHYPGYRKVAKDPEKEVWNAVCRQVSDHLSGFEVLKKSDLKKIFPKSSLNEVPSEDHA